jgi:hypothetical protein
MSEVSEYQSEIAGMLRHIYKDVEVKKEWSSAFGTGLYSPRVDIAVGPFAITQRFIEPYNRLMASSRPFILDLIRHHLINTRQITEEDVQDYPEIAEENRLFERLLRKNSNARCLMVIEIENTTSRKHLMGGAINAAALGRIGIAVAWNPDKLRAFTNLKRYLDYLARIGKNTFDTSNLLILDRGQLKQAAQTAMESLQLTN